MGSPCAINTKLGWIFSGMVYASSNARIQMSVIGHVEVEFYLKRFWALESIPNDDSVSLFEDTYAKTVIRTEAGRYVASLPFKSPPELGNTETRALKCFYHLEDKLDRDPILKRQYVEFMRDYLVLNHMELIPDSEVLNPRRYYLPHHGVRKDGSTTTKLSCV
ncbi:hypothetical protein AVEN_247265-1 [Araneus ventricosus]|uniref:Peptidase aspartic putative domain-containing protein n=1 Tax=Araneus ventricosus TaxID=182803 RepID=A0A4Y2UF77_ARAVE|nr:hypothetical protein AVEN_247265-1 [Araneus ventricosus]